MNTHSKPRAFTDRHASIDELDRSIVNLAVKMNRITHDFLVLVRRFDERAGWLKWSCENCAEWLHYRCDISKSAAREKVRVAHAIKTLPRIAMAFAEGRLSYSKVRALTRVATPENEEELLAFALTTTAARVEERCRELRCGTVASIDDAVRAHAHRELRMRRDEARGMITITVELPIETGELVDKALDRAMESEATSGPEFKEESWRAQRADALVAVAKAYLSGGREDGTGTPDHYQVTVHVDEAALRGNAGARSGLPIETVRRLACDSDLIALVEDKDGNPLSAAARPGWFPLRSGGRSRREIKAAGSRGAGASVTSMPTTSCTGRRAGRPASRTCCCSAPGTMRCCTRVALRSRRITGTAGFSGVRTGGRCRLAAIGWRTSPMTTSEPPTSTSVEALPRKRPVPPRKRGW